jgi:hypothetical protein
MAGFVPAIPLFLNHVRRIRSGLSAGLSPTRPWQFTDTGLIALEGTASSAKGRFGSRTDLR